MFHSFGFKVFLVLLLSCVLPSCIVSRYSSDSGYITTPEGYNLRWPVGSFPLTIYIDQEMEPEFIESIEDAITIWEEK